MHRLNNDSQYFTNASRNIIHVNSIIYIYQSCYQFFLSSFILETFEDVEDFTKHEEL